ncbi:Alpha-ribazole phosphatase [Pannonibacter phragmitetus]|uniref:Alpha-ribazole phosphatase n=1 Tax=Pannonibacter phragmitetus TaxID=121719 RepID=A0A378ZS33_9HYPH|nr:histidine phosphatase family protein [Pannonibacter phragmitetus]SUA99813.1 Alpha-ribazole phosphatase [Pannonibacter phragmitetus]
MADLTETGTLRMKLQVSKLLIFIRHGQTDWNAEGRMQGQKDIPLNDTGRGQARRNGQALASFLAHEGIDPAGLRFIASPLGRTRETMDLMREAMGLPAGGYELEPRVKEITFGDWEGRTLEELAASDPALVAQRRSDKWGFVPPQGESYAILSQRISGWLAEQTEPSVSVIHGGVIRVLRGLLEDIAPAEIPRLDVPQDVVYLWKDGKLSLI